MNIVPNQVLLDFFQEAIQTLQKDAKTLRQNYHHTNQSNNCNDSFSDTPFGDDRNKKSIHQEREFLLQIQMHCLQRVVSAYNHKHGTTTTNNVDTDITLEQAQTALKELGIRNLEDKPKEEEEIKLLESMEEMNEAARIGFTRLVLQSGWKLEESQAKLDISINSEEVTNDETEFLLNSKDSTKDGEIHNENNSVESMAFSDIKDFCALCTTAVKLPEVHNYLLSGEDLFSKDGPKLEDSNDDEPPPSNNDKEMIHPLQIQERLIQLQNVFYRAIGYDPQFAISQIGAFFTKSPSSSEEIDVYETLDNFMSDMKVAIENLIGQVDLLSDENEGGCTRVVSVNFSEFEIDPTASVTTAPGAINTSTVAAAAPIMDEMQQRVDEKQRRELEIARQAAELQQGILGELLTMEEQDRTDTLALAKETHDSFMLKVTELPVGPERVQFLQSISGEKQRLLVMHKLWEKLLKDHDGMPPTIRRDGR